MKLHNHQNATVLTSPPLPPHERKQSWSHLQQVKLYTTFNVDDLVLPLSHLTGLEHGLLHLGLGVTDTTQVRKVWHLTHKVSTYKVICQSQY